MRRDHPSETHRKQENFQGGWKWKFKKTGGECQPADPTKCGLIYFGGQFWTKRKQTETDMASQLEDIERYMQSALFVLIYYGFYIWAHSFVAFSAITFLAIFLVFDRLLCCLQDFSRYLKSQQKSQISWDLQWCGCKSWTSATEAQGKRSLVLNRFDKNIRVYPCLRLAVSFFGLWCLFHNNHRTTILRGNRSHFTSFYSVLFQSNKDK